MQNHVPQLPEDQETTRLWDRCVRLDKENHRYKVLIDDMITGLVQVDRNGVLVTANKTAAWYFGGLPSQIVGQSLKDLVPEQGEAITQMVQMVADSGQPFTSDKQITFPLGQRWMRSICYPIADGDHPHGLVQIESIDITEEKKFQEELIETERRRIELEKCLRKTQKIDVIGTLAGGIAHDFNNILSAIIGYAELVKDDLQPGTLTYDNLGEILVAGMRAKELIRQILTFSRQSEQQMQPVQVHSIVREVAGMLRSTIPTSIDLQYNNQTRNSTIFGDATQIHQVVLNLCTNSVHAMQEKSGKLNIELDTADHNPSTASNHEIDTTRPYIRLTVTDTGAGIAPELIDRIFEPYVTTKPSSQGTGLGLAVVHGIVKSHNGQISVKSQVGQGTTVEILLPLLQKEEQVPSSTDRALPMGSEHILLVDDEPQIVHMQRQALERLGYTVSARTSSLEALEAFKSHPEQYDAVITDMTMPNLTGDRLAQQMRLLRSEIPILLCTGYGEKVSKARAKTMGVDLLLMKPVGWADLAEALRLLLNGR